MRTGAGKSLVARTIAAFLRRQGPRVAVVRHPMPYGDLAQQSVQRFAALDDLDHARCAVEEREEYEPHIRQGTVVFAGVDYERILRMAEADADVLLWDGGNNDLPYAEEARQAVRSANPRATVIESAIPVTVDEPSLLRNRRVLVIEDGPTVTHGGMAYGAGVLAAKEYGAAELVDPRPFAVGTLRETFQAYPYLDCLLPAMGYGPEQLQDLEHMINRTDCDLVLIATPVDLRRLTSIERPTARATYDFVQTGGPSLEGLVEEAIRKARGK